MTIEIVESLIPSRGILPFSPGRYDKRIRKTSGNRILAVPRKSEVIARRITPKMLSMNTGFMNFLFPK